jgi:hypothetical protein
VTEYQHTQIGHVIIWGSLLLVAVVFAADANFGSSAYRTTLLLACVVLLIVLALFYKLTLRIDDKTLHASLGIGVIRKRVPTAEIAGCEPIRIRWWYGWGIHLTPYGWLYNVSGLGAVAITLRNGHKFALGTDDPDGLAAAIERSTRAQ